MNKKSILVVLITIFVIGAILRLYGLDKQSLWNDELASWEQSNYPTLREVLELGSIPDTHPPLFQIALFFVISFFDDSEIHLRLLPAISGVVSILAIYWLGLIVFSYREGLIAAFLTSILWVPVYYSQEARNYSFLILFTILSSAFWFRMYLRSERSNGFNPPNALGYIFFALLTIYTHYFGLLLICFQCLGALVFSIKDRRNFSTTLLLYLVILVGYLPWIPSVFAQFTHTQKIAWMDPPKITALPAFISFTFNRIEWLAIVVMLMFGFLFVKSVSRWRGKKGGRLIDLFTSSEFMLGYWLLVPFVFVYGFSLVYTPILTQRNLLIVLPPVYLLLGRSITVLPLSNILKILITFVFGVLPLHNMLFVEGYYQTPYKEQFREASAFVVTAEYKYSNAPVIAYAKSPNFFNYYFNQLGSSKRVDLMGIDEGDYEAIIDYVQSDESPYFWFIAGHTYSVPNLIPLLETEFNLIERKIYSGSMLWLFKEN